MKLLLPFVLLLSLSVQAQTTTLPFDSARDKVVYTAVVQVTGATQSELFGRAAKWLATLPNSANYPHVSDPGSGTLAARRGVPFITQVSLLKMPTTVWREVSGQVKDGRAKYDISDFYCHMFAPTPGQPSTPSKAQLKLTPLEEYLNKTDTRNHTNKGEPRVIPAGFIQAVREQSEAEIKSLTSALQTKSDW